MGGNLHTLALNKIVTKICLFFLIIKFGPIFFVKIIRH